MALSFFKSAQDLPLAKDASAKYLPWIISFLVFFAAFAVITSLAVQKLADRWDSSLEGRLTVQIPPPAEGGQEARSERLEAIISLLKNTPEVSEIVVLDESEAAALIEPWLGEISLIGQLPLPDLIAINLEPGISQTPEGLAERLRRTVEGTILDDHRAWLSHFYSLANSVRLTSLAIICLVGLATVLTVIFVTRTGLAIHRPEILLLHIMGAKDRQIASEFQRHAFRTCLRGAIIGTALAILAAFLLGRLLSEEAALVLPSAALLPLDWASLALLPLVAALVALLTARTTVLSTLKRLP